MEPSFGRKYKNCPVDELPDNQLVSYIINHNNGNLPIPENVIKDLVEELLDRLDNNLITDLKPTLKNSKNIKKLIDQHSIELSEKAYNTLCDQIDYKFPGWKYQVRDLIKIKFIPQVKVRDNFTCRLCGSQENLTVHHVRRLGTIGQLIYSSQEYPSIEEFVKAVADAHDVSDGTTICEKCHQAIHSLE
jgi:hypothetical protein